jgi:RNA polymerase sigma-70 factor (family 1)
VISGKLHKLRESFDYKKLSDKELMAIINRGDDAFLEVYKRYWKKLYLHAYNLLEDKQASEDVIQDVFTTFWTKKDKVAISNLSHYLYQAVKFQIFNLFRNGKIAQKHIDRIKVTEFVNSTEDSLNLKELEESLQGLLSQLPDRCREIFYASRFENLSHAEISDKFKISNQTVKNQVSKALKHLKGSMDTIAVLSIAFFL